MLPKEIDEFVNIFKKLPSIGQRQATRLAFKIINNGLGKIKELENAINGLKKIKICQQCFFIYAGEKDMCYICADKHRDENKFMIVEKATDLMSIENTNSYNGKYLVIGELTKSGVLEQWQKIRIETLKSAIKTKCNGKADEIIIALNLTTYGHLNSLLLSKELQDYSKKITKLGRGIPTGGEIEFADIDTLSSSINNRQP